MRAVSIVLWALEESNMRVVEPPNLKPSELPRPGAARAGKSGASSAAPPIPV